jgi:hypothetical protein
LDAKDIIVVSGLPRSGTSMLMGMLESGGLPILTDHHRPPDQDNPKGYYEFERVKKLERDKEWVADAVGKGIKVVSALLKHLPPSHSYKVIFMLRNTQEVVASQKQMLVRRGEQKRLTDGDMSTLLENHLAEISNWLRKQPNFDLLYLKYHDVLRDPIRFCGIINAFLGSDFDEAEMVRAVDKTLYRQRISASY